MNLRISSLLAAAALAASAAAGPAAADTVTPPKVDTHYPTPVIYPMDAQSSGEEGPVDLALHIDANGHPTIEYKMIGSSGHADLDNAALQSVMNWHYIPAHEQDGEPVDGWVRLHLDYKLPPKESQNTQR